METLKISVSWILRIIIAGLFIYAGILKIINPAEFYRDILNYQILPDTLVFATAYFLPPFEIVLGIGLLTKTFFKSALWGISTILVVFIIALLSTIARGLDISCGCFSSSNPSTAFSAILKDIVMLIACAIIYLLNANRNPINCKK